MAEPRLSFTRLPAAPAAVLRLVSPVASSPSRNNSRRLFPGPISYRGARSCLCRWRPEIDVLTQTSKKSIYTLTRMGLAVSQRHMRAHSFGKEASCPILSAPSPRGITPLRHISLLRTQPRRLIFTSRSSAQRKLCEWPALTAKSVTPKYKSATPVLCCPTSSPACPPPPPRHPRTPPVPFS